MQKELREFLTIFIHNYQKNYLAKCFERIFSQNSITDFEVVFSDAGQLHLPRRRQSEQ